MSPFPGVVVGDSSRLFSPWSSSLLSIRNSRCKAGLVPNSRWKHGTGLPRHLQGCSLGPMVGVQFSRSGSAGWLKFRPGSVEMAASTSSVGNNWVEEPSQQSGANEFQLQVSKLVRWASQKVEFSPELVALAFVAFILGELWVYGFTVLRFVILGISLVYFTRTVAFSRLLNGEFQSLRERAAKQLQNFTGFWRAARKNTISSPGNVSMVEDTHPVRKTAVNMKLKGKTDSDFATLQAPEDRDSDLVDSAVNGEHHGNGDGKRTSPSLVRLASTISTIVNTAGVDSINKAGSGIQSIRRGLYSEDPAAGVESDQIHSGATVNAGDRGNPASKDDVYISGAGMQAEQQRSGLLWGEIESDFSQTLGPELSLSEHPNNLESGELVDDGEVYFAASGSPKLGAENSSTTDASRTGNLDGGFQFGKRVSSADPWQNEGTREEDWTYNYENEVAYEAAPISGESASPDADASKELAENGGRFHYSGSADSWGKMAGGIAGTAEQRGSLTKSRAMGRGSNFGPVEDWDEDRSKERERSMASEEEKQSVYTDYGPGSGRGGHLWEREEQSVPYGRAARGYDLQTRSDVKDPAYGVGANVRRSQQFNDDGEVLGMQGQSLNQDWAMDNRALRRDVPSSAMDSSGADEDVASRETRARYSASRDFSSRSQDAGRGDEADEMDEGDSFWRGRRRMEEGSSRSVNRSGDGFPSQGRRDYGPEDADAEMGSSGGPSSVSSRELEVEQNLAIERLRQADSVQIKRYLDEAEALLEEGTQGLEGRIEVGVAESMLYEAAKLFERASDMDPTDLTAVGQWGNTLLVHGELKLKVSQQIRAMLPASRPTSLPFRGVGRDNADREREEMEQALQQVCEECEDLLVEAGRKYRRALSLDRTDVRALYNWGLALCYRGQLISEEGGETAILDADKVFLAATDKFEAMLGISQDYAAGALLNWGLALRDRSRLRPMGDRERFQILLQAKELFQDALRLDPNYGQARGAIAACLTELRELQSLEVEIQQKRDRKDGSSDWWRRGA